MTATGWPPGLLQDDDRRLSRALANTPHARRHAEEAGEDIAPRIGVDDWVEWNGGERPVPATTRVEVVQEGRHARGLALAFNWRGFGPEAVRFWRFERPGADR